MTRLADRRSVMTGALAAGLLGPLAFAPHAWATSDISFSFQQSSAVLLALKTRAVLEPKLRTQGFSASWHQFGRILESMTSGAVQFHGDAADAVPIFAQAAGAKVTYFAMESASPLAEALIVPADSAIHGVADLRGRSIAVSKGSGAHFLLVAALARAGLHLSDVTLVFLEASDGGNAFQAGHVDAWCIWDPFLAITEARRPIRVLTDATGLTSYNRYYMVDTGFAQAHPAVVQLVFDALAQAGRQLHTDPAGARALLVPLWGNVPPDVIDVIVKRRSFGVQPVSTPALAEQQRIANAFHNAGLIPRPLDLGVMPVWRPGAA